MRGNCYVAAEALYHILGGTAGDWVPQRMRLPDGETHWWLKHRLTGTILDPSRVQFGSQLPDYSQGRGAGFLTRQPSKRALAMIRQLTYQEVK